MIEEGLADLKLARHQRGRDGRAREQFADPWRVMAVWGASASGGGRFRLPISELSQRERRITLSEDR